MGNTQFGLRCVWPRIGGRLCVLFSLLAVTGCFGDIEQANGPANGDSSAPSSDTTAPAPVSSFTVAAGDGEVTLSWANPTDADFAGVWICRDTGGFPASPTSCSAAYNGTGTTHTDTGLNNGTVYYYAAFTYDQVPNYSAAVSSAAVPQATVAGVPSGMTATAGYARNTVSWNAITGATSYNLYWSASPGVTKGDNQIAGVASPYVHSQLNNGTTYYYAVAAVTSTGESPLSAQVGATPQNPQWAWVSGSNTNNMAGVYGSRGVAAESNMPGARNASFSWIDPSGALWLFGGYGFDSAGTLGNLNDLWRYDGANWTWMSGSNVAEAAAVYGVKGVASPGNVPGARRNGASWIDSDGNLWLFGGTNAAPGVDVLLNDLWKFDGTNWTWISGSSSAGASGVYGTKGTPGAANVPGARYNPAPWVGADGSLNMFGGYGYDASGACCDLNDVWKFDGADWTWMAGSSSANQAGVYGSKGVVDAQNVPGGRNSAVALVHPGGGLWLFGGFGRDATGNRYLLNDLWRFDGVDWVWISGSTSVNASGVYGTMGVPDPGNVPGARNGVYAWVGAGGSLWLADGGGYDSVGSVGYLNDVWRFDGTEWTWISGSKLADAAPQFGTKGVPDVGTTPGGRCCGAYWVDSSRSLWVFGGAIPQDPPGTATFPNDLWRYAPLP